MTDTRSHMSGLSSEAEITRQLLTAVHQNSTLTQRSISHDLGIALGLANAYLKRCTKKGLIKIKQVPKNRYAYYLTPKGFSEKSRLTAEYLAQSFNLFRAARREYGTLLATCGQQGWRDVILCGVGDIAEIATLCVGDSDTRLVGFYDPACGAKTFAGLEVFSDISALPKADAFIVTDLRDPQRTFNMVARVFPAERVLAPKLLGVSRHISSVEL
jgi:DNA-binding MarR family transcriptional regulator